LTAEKFKSIVEQMAGSNVPIGRVAEGHINRDFLKNYSAAAESYRQAADQGSAEGLLNLVYYRNL
jgi:TPR repeat protein